MRPQPNNKEAASFTPNIHRLPQSDALSSLSAFHEELNRKVLQKVASERKKKAKLKFKLPKILPNEKQETRHSFPDKENLKQARILQKFEERLKKLGLSPERKSRTNSHITSRSQSRSCSESSDEQYQKSLKPPTASKKNYSTYTLPVVSRHQLKAMIDPYAKQILESQTSKKQSSINESGQKQGKKKQKRLSLRVRTKLRRKLRSAMIAVYFSVLFPKYSQTVQNLKYNQIKAEQKQRANNEELALTGIIDIDFYQIMKEAEKLREQNRAEEEQNDEIVVTQQDNVKFTIDIEVLVLFVKKIIERLSKHVKAGKISPLYSFILTLFPNNYPLNGTLLIEQLQILKFDKFGRIEGKEVASKLLLMNYLMIKCLIFPLLSKHRLSKYFQRQIEKRPQDKAYLLVTSRKIKIALILMYSMINEIYKQNSSFFESNYHSLPEEIRSIPMKPLVYKFALEKKASVHEESQDIIKEITTNVSLLRMFSSRFQSIWSKLISIIQVVINESRKYELEMISKLKLQALESKFDKEGIKNNADNEETYGETYSETESFVEQPEEAPKGLAGELLFRAIDNIIINRKGEKTSQETKRTKKTKK